METWFHELDNESKMRLLETHSHTSERRDYEADKERQEQRERGLPVRGRKNVNENHSHIITWKGGRGARMCRRKR